MQHADGAAVAVGGDRFQVDNRAGGHMPAQRLGAPAAPGRLSQLGRVDAVQAHLHAARRVRVAPANQRASVAVVAVVDRARLGAGGGAGGGQQP